MVTLTEIESFKGFSSHFPYVAIPNCFGFMDYIEVHVKREYYPDNYCPIDNAVSITISELAELCQRVKE